MAANLVQGIDRIAGQLGYLVVNSEGAVMASGGDLENEENIASIIVKMLQYATKVPLSADDSQNCKRISVVYHDFTLLATVSNQKVYIIKKENEGS
ncbi:ragulator complex LAMTOR4 [Paramuricea clavata]|uniref:Late endosomal/lysosomal adaptor and MAPK and MTOR activator 4 n=1 Tax=Paramuricea clavata TaxID=317549 RepID=A0A6S7FJG7_PARCT|nr:ragulator complex LAMTOR4 [Paramuricea clavata]